MLESKPKAKLAQAMRLGLDGFETIRHEDRSTHAVPDISTTGLKRTSWWEVKMVDPSKPEPSRRETQHMRMMALATFGYAHYIIFEILPNGDKTTRIVPPKDLDRWREYPPMSGFAYRQILIEVLRLHGQA